MSHSRDAVTCAGAGLRLMPRARRDDAPILRARHILFIRLRAARPAQRARQSRPARRPAYTAIFTSPVSPLISQSPIAFTPATLDNATFIIEHFSFYRSLIIAIIRFSMPFAPACPPSPPHMLVTYASAAVSFSLDFHETIPPELSQISHAH